MQTLLGKRSHPAMSIEQNVSNITLWFIVYGSERQICDVSVNLDATVTVILREVVKNFPPRAGTGYKLVKLVSNGLYVYDVI